MLLNFNFHLQFVFMLLSTQVSWLYSKTHIIVVSLFILFYSKYTVQFLILRIYSYTGTNFLVCTLYYFFLIPPLISFVVSFYLLVCFLLQNLNLLRLWLLFCFCWLIIFYRRICLRWCSEMKWNVTSVRITILLY